MHAFLLVYCGGSTCCTVLSFRNVANLSYMLLFHVLDICNIGHHRIVDNLEDEAPLFTVMKTIVGKAWFGRFVILFLLVVWEDKFMDTDPEEVNLWFIIFEFISAYSKCPDLFLLC
jgi:hypothetical protein